MYDENDYSGFATSAGAEHQVPGAEPEPRRADGRDERQVREGPGGAHSKTFYTSYSLLKSMEAGFRLPCLNHACDKGVNVMTDLFGNGGW